MGSENSRQFDITACNNLKVGDILLIDDSGKYEYVRIGTINTAKPGKHGSTKFLIKGTNILTRKKHEVSFTSGSKVTTVKLKRTEYSLIDIDGDEVSVTIHGSGNEAFETLNAGDFPEKDIEVLKNNLDRESDAKITFVIVSAFNFFMIEDLRKDGKII